MTKKPKILHKNYHGFDHNVANQKFTGGLTYMSDIQIESAYEPFTLYKVDNPDRSKGHKSYMMLFFQPLPDGRRTLYVTGREEEKFADEDRFRDGVHCKKCDTIAYSSYRHDYTTCECGTLFIDGGKDYTRTNSVKLVTVDLLTNTIVKTPKSNNKGLVQPAPEVIKTTLKKKLNATKKKVTKKVA